MAARLSELAQACLGRYSIQDFRSADSGAAWLCELRLAGRTPGLRYRKSLLNSDLKQRSNRFSGGCVERVTPVPIPNTEVKPLGADGTARATAWESRKPPGLLVEARERNLAGFFVNAHHY